MPETTPLIKAALNLRVGAGFDVYFTMWLVDVYNYDKEIKLIFIFWFDIVMQFFYIKKYTRL